MTENTARLDKFKGLLCQEKERLEREMAKFHHDTGKSEPDVGKRAELGTADSSVSLSEVEREMGYHVQMEGQLTEIGHALRRLDEGTFGLCELCGEAINDARLEALPFAKLCIDCQEKTEG